MKVADLIGVFFFSQSGGESLTFWKRHEYDYTVMAVHSAWDKS
jgi:hypothetical protein